MLERKTVGQLMEEMRLKAGAQNYHGHEYMDLERFAEDTRHMIIFDVLTDDSPVGWKGERTRLFLTEAGYQKSLENQEKGHIKILSHAKVRQGRLGAVHNTGTGVGQGPVQIKKDRLLPHNRAPFPFFLPLYRIFAPRQAPAARKGPLCQEGAVCVPRRQGENPAAAGKVSLV